MEKKLHKSINRYGNVIMAEIWCYGTETNPITGNPFRMDVCHKEFSRNIFMGMIAREPTDETYQKANAWADEVIRMHEENTSPKLDDKIILPTSIITLPRQVTDNPNIHEFYQEIFNSMAEILIRHGLMRVANSYVRGEKHVITYTLCLPKLPISYMDKFINEKGGSK